MIHKFLLNLMMHLISKALKQAETSYNNHLKAKKVAEELEAYKNGFINHLLSKDMTPEEREKLNKNISKFISSNNGGL